MAPNLFEWRGDRMGSRGVLAGTDQQVEQPSLLWDIFHPNISQPMPFPAQISPVQKGSWNTTSLLNYLKFLLEGKVAEITSS